MNLFKELKSVITYSKDSSDKSEQYYIDLNEAKQYLNAQTNKG